MAQEPEFHAELQWLGLHLALVDVDGEVDLYTSPQLKRLLAEAIDTGADRIVADFRDVTFVDSTALGVLLTSARRLRSSAATSSGPSSRQPRATL